MDRSDEILAVLTEMRDLQRQALANQQQSIAAQNLAIERQNSHLRLYRMVVLIVLPLIAVLGYAGWRIIAPYL
jgi:hypothetical protein